MTKKQSFPFAEHRTCLTLTRLSVDHLPRDGTLGRVRKFRKGSDIWQAEDPADRIYFLQRGAVNIYSGDPQARDVLLQAVTAGEPFGELCFCAETRGVRNTVARTSTPATILDIEYVTFLKYLRTANELLAPLVVTMCIRLSDCETRTEILAQRGAQERVGGLLLQLAAKVAKTSSSHRKQVVLHLSHGDLARMAAMSRPHVTVTLGRFRLNHLVQYSRERALIVNIGALTSYLASRQTALSS